MSTHTKEPWRLGKGNCVVADEPVIEISGTDALEYYGGHLIAESVTLRNSRRIVACINACAGLETELLESIVLTGETLKSRFDLLKAEIEDKS